MVVQREHPREAGISLIELMFTVSILGILSMLSIETFKLWKERAGEAVSNQALYDARLAFAAGNVESENLPTAITYPQEIPGELQNNEARRLLPGFMLPRNTKIAINYGSNCVGSGELSFIETKHCLAKKHMTWTRYCDGVEIMVEYPGTQSQCS